MGRRGNKVGKRQYPSPTVKFKGELERQVKPLPVSLFQEWTHSFEEDGDGILIYRPFNFDFPPSRRPRDGYEFMKDGRVVRYIPGPADAPAALRGRFKHDEEKTLHLFFEDPHAKEYSIRIVACDERALRIKLV